MELKPPDSRRFLVAVDDSENARRCVKYAASLLREVAQPQIMLLHIIPEPDDDFFQHPTQKSQWLEDYRGRADATLLNYQNMLIHRGIKAACIQVRCERMTLSSVAECILRNGRAWGAGTIAVGRRGLSHSEEFLFGSTSSRIVQHARGCTVWVVE